jgi:hypothetical protein
MLRIGKQPRPPVIHDDDVELSPSAGTGEDGRVGGNRLTGCAAREEPQKGREVGEARKKLLDPHRRDMEGGEVDAEIGIPLVRADDEATRFGNGEIHPRDSRLCGEEPFTQIAAGHLGQSGRVLLPGGTSHGSVEQCSDLTPGSVNRRDHEVRGRLLSELHDSLPEVRVDHLDSATLEVSVQPTLLGKHRLALCDTLNPSPLE